MTTRPWSDWLTPSYFRIRIAPAAARKLELLPEETQERLRQMLQDIAELADLLPPSSRTSFRPGDALSLLRLQLGRADVRYSISEESRTLAVEHVILAEEGEREQAG